MSKIKQVGANLWTAPTDMGFTPNFKRTKHAIKYYPNGDSLIHEPLQPENKKIFVVYKNKDAEDMGEIFEGSSAGGHEGYLDMRVDSVANRGGSFYMMGIIGLLFWWSFESFVLSYVPDPQLRDISIYSGYAFFIIGAFVCFVHYIRQCAFIKTIRRYMCGTKKCFTEFLGTNVKSPSKLLSVILA